MKTRFFLFAQAMFLSLFIAVPAWASKTVEGVVRLQDDNSPAILNHYPLDTTQALLCSIPALDEFLNQPLAYVNAIALRLRPVSQSSLEFK